MHLLDDTENDFSDQLRIDTLRKEVVELLRNNQTLETEVQELDTKIALILKNKMTFEDLVRAKRRHGAATGDESFHAPGGGDPFTNVHLDRTSQRKLELFEHLFFTLQTDPTYLCRLLHKLAADPELDADRRVVEDVTLILFGYGQDRREEYLFHRLVQISVHEQILRSRSLQDLAETPFAIVPVATQFVRARLTPYLYNVLHNVVKRVLDSPELDLSTDPTEIYNRIINAEESLTGVKSGLRRDLTADQILQTHGETRTLYIQNLQELRALTDMLCKDIMRDPAQLPYTVRLVAREALFACRVRFQDHDDRTLWPVVTRAVILPFILPAIVKPEAFSIADTVNPIQRRNLLAVSNLFSHVAAQGVVQHDKDRLICEPLSEYIRAEGQRMCDWVLDVAEVDFHKQEMLETTSEATPINITRKDIYGLLSVLVRNVPVLTVGKADDPIASVLNELEGPPIGYDQSNNTVRLRVTNRLAQLQQSDPRLAQLRELEVQAKRHVLAVLRVQTGKDLYDVFLKHPTEEDEQRWIYEVHRDIALDQARLARHDLPPTPAEAEYQMENIRS
jgi:Ras GTPase-activating-like protein IQGAP2/3